MVAIRASSSTSDIINPLTGSHTPATMADLEAFEKQFLNYGTQAVGVPARSVRT